MMRGDAEIAARTRIFDALVLDHAKLLRNHVELLADLHAKLDERVTIVHAEAFSLRQLVPHHVARQVGIKRLAMAPLLARMCADRRFWRIFLSR
jgi:hypothetical protein